MNLSNGGELTARSALAAARAALGSDRLDGVTDELRQAFTASVTIADLRTRCEIQTQIAETFADLGDSSRAEITYLLILGRFSSNPTLCVAPQLQYAAFLAERTPSTALRARLAAVAAAVVERATLDAEARRAALAVIERIAAGPQPFELARDAGEFLRRGPEPSASSHGVA